MRVEVRAERVAQTSYNIPRRAVTVVYIASDLLNNQRLYCFVLEARTEHDFRCWKYRDGTLHCPSSLTGECLKRIRVGQLVNRSVIRSSGK